MKETVVVKSSSQLEEDAAALFNHPNIKPEQCVLRPDAKIKLD